MRSARPNGSLCGSDFGLELSYEEAYNRAAELIQLFQALLEPDRRYDDLTVLPAGGLIADRPDPPLPPTARPFPIPLYADHQREALLNLRMLEAELA